MTPYKLAKIGRYLIYLVLFTPLLIAPKTLWEFVFIRNLFFYLIVVLLLLVSILYIYKNKTNINYKINSLFWLILGFIIIKIISGIFGVDPITSFFGTQPRMDGNIGYIMLFGFLISLLLFIDSKKEWNKIFKISIFVASISLIFSLIQPFFPAEGFLAGSGSTNFFSHRLIGTLGNPIFFAGYLLPHIFLSIYLGLEEKNNKFVRYTFFGLSLFFIFITLLTKTRGSLMALLGTAFVIFIFSLFYFLKIRKKNIFSLLLLVIPISGFLLLALSSLGLVRHFSDFSLTSTTVITRFMLWKIGIQGFFDKILLGWGSENYAYIFSKFYNPKLLKYSFYETWADKPHNQLIEILATNGIFGLLFFIAIILVALYKILIPAWKNKDSFIAKLFIAGVILSFLIHIFFAFDTLEFRIVLFLIFGFIIFIDFNSKTKQIELSQGLLKGLFLITFFISFISLYLIGVNTVRLNIITSATREALIINDYTEVKKNIVKMPLLSSPYQNGNWENLADVILNSDASGRLPASISKEILPIIIKELKIATEKNPNNFSYNYRLAQMYNLAGIYIDRKYFDDAVIYLNKSKTISPERQVSDLLLAQVYYYQRDLDKALKLLEDLIAKNPEISQPYWYLGILYNASGDSEKAFAYMSTAVANGYGLKLNENILYVNILSKFNKYEEMEYVYKNIVELDKKNPTWWANLAFVYLELKKYDDARNATRQAIFMDPSFGNEGENFLQKINDIQYGKVE